MNSGIFNDRLRRDVVDHMRVSSLAQLPVSWSLLLLTVNSLDISINRHLVIAAGLLLGWLGLLPLGIPGG